MGAEGRYEDWVYLGMMEREWKRPVADDDRFSGFSRESAPSPRASIVLLFWSYFETRIERLLRAGLYREKYSAARAGFATEWNARRMLGFVEQINPNFYPVPLKPPQQIAPGHKFFDRVADGFLTKEDFSTLYDGSAEVLHCRNPYAPGDPTIDVKYTVDEWSRRIKALLSWHFVQIVDVQGLWVIQVPDQGPVQGFPAAADGPFVVEPFS
jgi:hypothetical protein